MENTKKPESSSRFIPGIYNYCDRWCERCAFTSRCLTFAMGRFAIHESDSLYERSCKLWERISAVLQVTIEVLEETGNEEGIDLDELRALADEKEDEEAELQRLAAREHPCAKAARAYARLVEKWNSLILPMLKEKLEVLKSLEISTSLPADGSLEIRSLVEAVETINWYQHFIHIKLVRAISHYAGKYDPTPEMRYDADGSAKIALIAVDRSIIAWMHLYRELPELEDEILEFLRFLDQLRKAIEMFFPRARSFRRPGFDTEPAPIAA